MLRIYVDALYLSRRQTTGVAEATLRFVDDERTAQTREDGVPNESVIPIESVEERRAVPTVRFARRR